MIENEDNANTKLLREHGAVQIWQVNYTPAPHRRFQATTYLVQVIGREAEAFRLPSAAWERFEKLCERSKQRSILSRNSSAHVIPPPEAHPPVPQRDPPVSGESAVRTPSSLRTVTRGES